MPTSPAPILVSCILLTYNHRPYVRQAVESMLMQKTDFPFEILFADDCSQDGTREILTEYAAACPDCVRTCFPAQNMGGSALHTLVGATLCRGKYMTILEGDDYWVGDDRLQTLVDFLESHPDYACVAHLRERRDESGQLLDYDPQKKLFGRDFTMEQFLSGARFSITGALYLNHYRLVGERYRALETLTRNADDYQRCVIIHDFGKVYLLPRCFYAYRVIARPGGTNYNSIMSDQTKYRDQMRILRAMQAFYEDRYDFSGEIRRWQSKHLLLALLRGNRAGLKEIWTDATPAERARALPYIPVYAVKKLCKIGDRSGWKLA